MEYVSVLRDVVGRRELLLEHVQVPIMNCIDEKSGFGGSGTGVLSIPGEPAARPAALESATVSAKALRTRPK